MLKCQLEGSRSGSSLSLQRGLQPPSSSSHRAAGGVDSSATGGTSVHRSTSSANPSSSSSSQKPSRRHSQDTHGTMHASAAAGGMCLHLTASLSTVAHCFLRLSNLGCLAVKVVKFWPVPLCADISIYH